MTWTHTHKKHITTANRQKTLRRDNWTCQNCGWEDPTGKTLDIDHKHNLATGGTNHPDNLWTLCRWCHNHKTQQEAATSKNSWKKPKQKHPGLK